MGIAVPKQLDAILWFYVTNALLYLIQAYVVHIFYRPVLECFSYVFVSKSFHGVHSVKMRLGIC